MDQAAFVALVDRHLGPFLDEGDRRSVGDQFAVDFYHPRTRTRLANLAGGALPMYKSGVVYHAPTRTVKVTLRVPERIADDVLAALKPPDAASLTVTDKRPATTATGEVLSLTHCALRLEDADEDALETFLTGVSRALQV